MGEERTKLERNTAREEVVFRRERQRAYLIHLWKLNYYSACFNNKKEMLEVIARRAGYASSTARMILIEAGVFDGDF